MSLVDYNSLLVSEDHDESTIARGGEQVMAAVGTKEGKVLIMKVTSTGYQKLAQTKGGISFGEITAVDVSVEQDKIFAATQSGEMFSLDLLTNIEE